MIYLCNGLSESMKRDPNMKNVPYPLTEDEFTEIIHNIEFTSVIGHRDLSECLSEITGKEIPYNRRGILLNYDDYVLLTSLSGRLPEHPREIEIRNRLNFSFIRFQKQTAEDLLETQQIIEEITNIGEI